MVEHESHLIPASVDACDPLRKAATKSSIVWNSTLAKTVRSDDPTAARSGSGLGCREATSKP